MLAVVVGTTAVVVRLDVVETRVVVLLVVVTRVVVTLELVRLKVVDKVVEDDVRLLVVAETVVLLVEPGPAGPLT